MKLCRSFTETTRFLTCHLCVKVANFGSINASFVNRQLAPFCSKHRHCTIKKLSSLSSAGLGGGGPGVLCEGALVGGGGPGQQNWQVFCLTGVIGLI